MKKRLFAIMISVVLAAGIFAGCGESAVVEEPAVISVEEEPATASEEQTLEETAEETAVAEAPVEDGVYSAKFNTDSSMFHINEACEGRGVLTVENGQMTMHITLVSKNIVNLYPGSAEDAQKEGAELIEPTIDPVTYSDGYEEEVYGFDIPVPYIDKEFDMALIGTHDNWYDHKVSVSDLLPLED